MKRRLLCLVFALMALFVFTSTAMASNRAEAWSVTPFVGGYHFDSDIPLDDSVLYGFRMGYNFTKHWTLEGVVTYSEPDGKKEWIYPIQGRPYRSSNDADIFGYRGEVLYNFLPDGMIVPFVAAGIGGLYADWDKGGSDHDLVLDYGAGLKIFFAEDWAVRADIRHLYLPDDSYNNVEYGVGLSYFFGGKKEAVPPPPPPPPAPKPAPVVEPDSDRDGVIDRLDQCPDTPYGVKVDEVGCPIDSDGDGVPDYLDKCPDTPRDLKVDKDGCPIKVTVNLNVLFDFDKADVKPRYHDEIKRLADYMIKYPWEKGVLEGHTCSIGTEEYNQRLSQRRVDSIKAYLVEKFGVEADRLQAVGYGESRPIASNATEEGRQLNRRVQAVMETYIRK